MKLKPRVQKRKFQVPTTKFRVPNLKFRVPSTKFRVLRLNDDVTQAIAHLKLSNHQKRSLY
ncbi:MAG: hypothetical protein KME57_05470 [Scytonema hyalinum WJT4-NPBG1]|nr:hypothetical protein [Scytonema hyalinum WJT4-NPBG1]